MAAGAFGVVMIVLFTGGILKRSDSAKLYETPQQTNAHAAIIARLDGVFMQAFFAAPSWRCSRTSRYVRRACAPRAAHPASCVHGG